MLLATNFSPFILLITALNIGWVTKIVNQVESKLLSRVESLDVDSRVYFIKLKFLSQLKSSKICIHDAIEMGLVFKNQFELSKLCVHKIPVLNLAELSLQKSIGVSLCNLKIKHKYWINLSL